MKFCVDCAHYRRGENKDCAAPAYGLSPETGKPRTRWAELEREGFYTLWGLIGCGPRGKWFEPKEPK